MVYYLIKRGLISVHLLIFIILNFYIEPKRKNLFKSELIELIGNNARDKISQDNNIPDIIHNDLNFKNNETHIFDEQILHLNDEISKLNSRNSKVDFMNGALTGSTLSMIGMLIYKLLIN